MAKTVAKQRLRLHTSTIVSQKLSVMFERA
jgi:hypothetical protein